MQKLLNIGVDVAKDAVVVGCDEQGSTVHSIPNNRTALMAWLASLPSRSRIGMEATGCYHELLADLAHEHGHTVFVLNPKDTRHYAQAVGLRAKTDRVRIHGRGGQGNVVAAYLLATAAIEEGRYAQAFPSLRRRAPGRAGDRLRAHRRSHAGAPPRQVRSQPS
jgi:transposase